MPPVSRAASAGTVRVQSATVMAARDAAIAQGGRHLGRLQIRARDTTTWCCAKGHKWKATASSVAGGSWCGACAGNVRLTIGRMRDLADARGGRCVSTSYINARTPLTWACAEGHTWTTAPANIVSGRWCPVCAGNRPLTLDQVQTVAAQRGGRCHATRYERAHQRVEWSCAEGHRWTSVFYHIMQGGWCPTCASGRGERICREALEHLFGTPFPRVRPDWLVNPGTGKYLELDGYAESLDLAFEYQGRQHYVEDGYRTRTPDQLAQRQRLDQLKRQRCSDINVLLIEIPQFERHETAAAAVCAAVTAAFAQSGRRLPRGFDRRRATLRLTDAYTPKLREEMEQVVTARGGLIMSAEAGRGGSLTLTVTCSQQHTWQTSSVKLRGGAWCRECSGRAPLGLSRMQAVALERGGRCLSPTYTNTVTPMLWECQKRHRWWSTPATVKSSGSWCPICIGRTPAINGPTDDPTATPADRPRRTPITLAELQGVAQARGGHCLARAYTADPLPFVCAAGHAFSSTGTRVRSGTWCRVCTWRQPDFEEVKAYARQRGGRCLTTHYHAGALDWSCSAGHRWSAPWKRIHRAQTWCSQCANTRKIKVTIADLKAVAQERGGRCLSPRYLGGTVKHRWKCTLGHRWEAIPANVRNRGAWCPECARLESSRSRQGVPVGNRRK